MYSANTKETAYFLPLNGTVSGQISNEFDELWFYLEVPQGKSGIYRFYTESSGTSVPMVGSLANSSGWVTDVSAFENGQFNMYANLEENEMYYLLLMSQGEGTGQFTLKTHLADPNEPGFAEDEAAESPIGNKLSQNIAADPVDISRGAFTSKVDLLSFSNGQKLSVSAHYDSQLRCSGSLGIGWYHNYEKKLVPSASGMLLYESPQNYQCYSYNYVLDRYECSSPGKQGYTIRLENGQYRLDCNKDHYEWYDADSGALIKVVNHEGQEITLTHSVNSVVIRDAVEGNEITLHFSSGKLVRVTDNTEREAHFYFTDDLLTSIEDANENSLTFSYSEERYLINAADSLGITYVTNVYSDGKVVAQRDANYHYTYFDYDGNTVTITNRNGDTSRRVYDDAGLLISYTDENDNTTAYTYDARGNILTETDALGKVKTMEYNSFNKPIRIVDKNGNSTTFVYDENGNILSIVYPNGGTESFVYYDGTNRLKNHTNLNGLVTTYTYDSVGRVISQKDGDRNPTTYERYDSAYYDFCDPKGIWHYHDLDACGRISCKYVPVSDEEELVYSTSYEYNNTGDCLKITDPLGNETLFEYDANHQKIAQTDAKGNRTTYQYNGNMKLIETVYPDGSTVTNEYDPEDRLIRVVDSEEKETCFTYDDGGRLISKQQPDGGIWSYTYDAVGNVLTETNPLGGVTARTYDAMGNKLTETTPDGVETTYTYDAMGRVVLIYSTQLGSRNFLYNNAGLLTWEEDGPGKGTFYTYDVYGNKLTEQIGYGNTYLTTYAYDANNNLIASTDRLGNITTFEYDSCNQCVKTTDPKNHSTLFGYDACGRRTSVTDPRNHTVTTAYDGVGNVLSVTDAKGNVILSKTYNNRNLPATVTNAGGTRTFTYNAAGKPLSVTDAFGTKQFAYDDMGRMIRVTDEAGGVCTTTYDLMGNPLTVTGPGGAVTTYTYDNMGRKISQTTPSGGTVTFSNFNEFGSPCRMVDARGNEHLIGRDTYDRVFSHSASGIDEQFNYDLMGNLLSSSEGSHTVTRTFDPMNRMMSYAEGNDGLPIYYWYDEVGNLMDMTFEGGHSVAYTYDASGNLLSVTDLTLNVTVSYTYDENNQLLTETKPDGSVTTYTYDAYQRITSKVARTASNAMIIGYEYSYDSRGRLSAEKDLVKNRLMCYTYDNRDWVTNRRIINLATEEYVDEPFAYDNAGNLQNPVGDPTPTYDANNRLVEYQGLNYSYDADGNLLGDELLLKPVHYTYDAKNRMTYDGADLECSYNAENLRYRVYGFTPDWSESLIDCYDLYDTSRRLPCLLKRESETYLAYYFHGLGLVGEMVEGCFKTYHYDYRGSTVAITDPTGAVIDTFEYDAYGKQTAHTGSTDTPFRYNGRDGVMTENNGLLYMRARYYDPNMRRFISADPIFGSIDNAVTLNRYAYANANPVTNIDPFGLSAERGCLDSYLSDTEIRKLYEIYQSTGITLDCTEISVNSLYSSLVIGLKNTKRPNNVPIKVWNKQIAADIKWVDDVLGTSSKISKSLDIVSIPWIDIISIGVDAGMGIYENIKNNEKTEEVISDAVLDVGFGAASVGLSALGAYVASSAVAGTAIGTAVPGLGNAIGAVVGAVVGTAFFVFTEVFEYNGKTGTAWFDSWF